MTTRGIDWASFQHWDWSNAEIARSVGVSASNVRRMRKKYGPSGVVAGTPVLSSIGVDLSDTQPSMPAAPGTVREPRRAPGGYAPQPAWLDRMLLIPDTHAPYHDPRAWATMVLAARVFKPSTLVHLGDHVDMFSVSRHDKDPRRKLGAAEELSIANGLLDELDTLDSVCDKYFCMGNHETMLFRHVRDKAPDLLDVTPTVQDLLRLEERGWRWCEHGDGFHLGKLWVTHDMGHAGIHAIRASGQAYGGNVAIGHVHQLGIHYDGNARGDTHVAASFGWLARNDVAWDYKNRIKALKQYQHGFGIGYRFPDGSVQLHAVPIVKGRCVIEGVVVEVAK